MTFQSTPAATVPDTTRCVIARATPRTGENSHLKTLVEELARNVRAEPGNISFEVYAEESGALVMIERYRDDAAFQMHLDQPHTKQFNAALEEIATGGGSSVSEVTLLEGPRTSKSGIRGIDHIGLTVPDIEEASRFFADAFGAVTLYDVLPKDADPMAGEGPEAELGLSKGAKIVHMRLMRLGKGPCLELFQMENADQADPARLQDRGLTHFGVYVDDIDAALDAFTKAGGEPLKGPHPLANNEDAEGNAGIYGRTPWGMLIELLTYPGGISYPAEAAAARWTPRR
ncbi:antibiotic biosynthesis monooxygenase [Jiella mangrovi]|uniref:VOC family protein n=1 Tax=Jiella mangrovi TaxID=2821407 RepID=A0ABS4BN48_9HYPH|nr:VOC family protein [Jiella mangrovi]